MKKLLNIFVALAIGVIAMVSFTACSDDDDTTKCGFSLGIESLSFSGSGDSQAIQNAVFAYSGSIEQAYNKALGLTDNAVILDGDFKSLCEQMKTKFEATQLPAALELENATYEFTYVLRGYVLKGSNIPLEEQTVVASKTFKN